MHEGAGAVAHAVAGEAVVVPHGAGQPEIEHGNAAPLLDDEVIDVGSDQQRAVRKLQILVLRAGADDGDHARDRVRGVSGVDRVLGDDLDVVHVGAAKGQGRRRRDGVPHRHRKVRVPELVEGGALRVAGDGEGVGIERAGGSAPVDAAEGHAVRAVQGQSGSAGIRVGIRIRVGVWIRVGIRIRVGVAAPSPSAASAARGGRGRRRGRCVRIGRDGRVAGVRRGGRAATCVAAGARVRGAAAGAGWGAAATAAAGGQKEGGCESRGQWQWGSGHVSVSSMDSVRGREGWGRAPAAPPRSLQSAANWPMAAPSVKSASKPP